MIYVEENESTKRLKIVHIANDGSNNEHLKKDIEVLDRAYPDIDIDFIEIEGQFGPEMIDQLSRAPQVTNSPITCLNLAGLG